jgi:hypothetical protein
MGRRLESSTTPAVATSNGALTPGMALAAAVMEESAPPSGSSAQKALVRWVGGEGAMTARFSCSPRAHGPSIYSWEMG